jgi:hypothetical protein
MRLISILVVVGIVLLLVGANIATTQLQSSMEDKEIRWKEYNARSYGWSMKYPADWEVERNRKERSVDFSGPHGFLYVLSVEPAGRGRIYLLDRIADNFEENLKNDGEISGVVRWDSSMGDYEAVGFSFTSQQNGNTLQHKAWVIVKEDKAFWIECVAFPKYFDEYDTTYFIRMRTTFELI